jgi:dihydroorotase-like cyclic amidohydrolase
MSEGVNLRGGRVVDPITGTDEVRDVPIVDGRVADDGRGDAEVIDCTGLIVAPGLVDMHTHLREPGFEHKETIETGTRSAAVGGYTAVAPMANTDPVADHAGVIHEVRDLAAASSRWAPSRRVSRVSPSPRSATWWGPAFGCSATTDAACPRRVYSATRSSTRRRSTTS